MLYNKPAYCPVGEHARLGVIVKGEVCSFLCPECQFIFTWDAKGKLLVPVKHKEYKSKRCGCGSCVR